MAAEKNTFSEIFNIVKATRHKGLKEKFNPLSDAALPELKLLLTEAIAKAEKVPSLKAALTEASHAIDAYNGTGSATAATAKKPVTGEGPYHWGATTVPEEPIKPVVSGNSGSGKKPDILTDMQKNLYKALKPYVGK